MLEFVGPKRFDKRPEGLQVPTVAYYRLITWPARKSNCNMLKWEKSELGFAMAFFL